VLAALVAASAAVVACTSGGSPSPSRPATAPSAAGAAPPALARAADALPGMPPLLDQSDVYAADRPGELSAVARQARPLVYVPHTKSNDVWVIDPRTYKVVERIRNAGVEVQHVVPSYDLRTLYAAGDRSDSLLSFDPRTGKPGRRIHVADPYNLYFTPDGRHAIVVAEALKRLDFYDPHSWRLQHSLRVPACAGVDHLDFTAGGRELLASCEFADRMIVVDVARQAYLRMIPLTRVAGGMPQDVKLSPDGRVFYVADMMANGVYEIDGAAERVIGFLPTGKGVHGLYVDRASRRLFASNRGEGSISVIDLATRRVAALWRPLQRKIKLPAEPRLIDQGAPWIRSRAERVRDESDGHI